MKRVIRSFLFLVLLVTIAAYGQNPPGKNQGGRNQGNRNQSGKNQPVSQPQINGSNPNQPNNAPTPSLLGSNLANTVTNITSPSDDHLPCFFNLKQLMDLRPVPSVPKLTAADESRVMTSVIEAVDGAGDKELSLDQKAEFIHKLAGDLDGRLIGKTPGEALATLMDTLYQIAAEREALLKAAANKEELLETLPKNASEGLKNKLRDPNTRWFVQSDPRTTLKNLSSIVAPELPAFAQEADEASVQGTNALNASVANTARSAISKFARPDDIGCAYQILSWDESRLLFGRSVANNFIAVQITVRNLNAKEEFIVHNAMLAVDVDIHGAVGRYFEGTDKISVEAYNNAGEALTPRGIVGNAIAATSTLLGTLQPIVDADNFNNAVAAFTGGVVPGWKTLMPDHQKDQLLLIANSGFSATYTTKTVVGKSGAATFYTWFPVKPFLAGWWVQDCAQSVVTVGNLPTPGTTPPQIGVDLDRARRECATTSAANWKTKPYNKWSSVSDQLFRDASLAVVAGIHVQQENRTKPSVADLSCPKNTQGNLDLSQAGPDGTFLCKLQGENLDKVSKLRLENAGNAMDPLRPEATVNVSGDNTTADAKFRVSDLAAASGPVYNVFTVANDGTETATSQKIQFDTKPLLMDVNPSSLDLANVPKNIELTLTGFNFNKLTKLCLRFSSNEQAIELKKDKSNTQASVDITSLKPKLSAGSWQIFLESCVDANNSKKILTITDGRPQITSFEPTSAKVGVSVTIHGSNLAGTTDVSFGGVKATPTAKMGDTIIVAVPKGAKSGPITLTISGSSIAAKGNFKVLPTPAPAKKPPSGTGGKSSPGSPTPPAKVSPPAKAPPAGQTATPK